MLTEVTNCHRRHRSCHQMQNPTPATNIWEFLSVDCQATGAVVCSVSSRRVPQKPRLFYKDTDHALD